MNHNKNPKREDVSLENQWDLSSFYNNITDWENDFNKLKSQINNYKSLQNSFPIDAAHALKILDFDSETTRLFEKLYVYAHLKNDEDKTNSLNEETFQKISMAATALSEESSYIIPEIINTEDEILKDYLNSQELLKYKFLLEKILRRKKHTLDREKENLLSSIYEISDAPSDIFSKLNNADMKFGKITDEKNNSYELTHSNFSFFLMNPNREIRKEAFNQYYKTYDEHKFSLSASLSNSIRKDWLLAKIRNYNSSLEKALFSDNVNLNVYNSLITNVKNNISPIEKYMNFRKKKLNIESLHFYDTYVPLIPDIDFTIEYSDAVDLCIDALKPLGDNYCNILKDGLLHGWVDKYENIGKRSGAYSSGCYDSKPYILLNYNKNDINSVYTLIHEAGHSMHSYFSNNTQNYHYADYSIFVAEVASTVNEFLLTQHLLNKYSDNYQMHQYILNREIDNIRATLYRQTMFAEFELLTHKETEKDSPLSLDSMIQIYNTLIKDYFGNSLCIDNYLQLEFLRIPHFYSSFYVYKYATGISAALSIGNRIINGSQIDRDNYLKFLTLGSSMFPIEELKTTGVDMNSSEPVISAINYFSKLVNKLSEG